MKLRTKKRAEIASATLTQTLCLIFFGSALCALTTFASAPSWWNTRGAVVAPVVTTNNGVVTTNYVRDDSSVVTEGQLKQFTQKAVQEMNANLPGGAGTNLNSLIGNWMADYATHGYNATNIKPSDYSAMNVGQLKYIGGLVYGRLAAVGYPQLTPAWLHSNTNTDNAAANLGQLKQVFNFDFSLPGAGNLTAVAGPSGTVNLSWTLPNPNSATSWLVERQNADGSWTIVTTLTNPNATSYVVTGLADGQSYQFQVVAAGGHSVSLPSNGVSVVTGLTPIHTYVFSHNDGADSVGNANGVLVGGGAVANNALQCTGPSGQGLALNGPGVTNSAVAGITGSFSIEMRLTRSADGLRYPVAFAFGSDSTHYLIFNTHRGAEGGIASIEFNSPATGYVELDFPASIPVDSQEQVVVTYDAATHAVAAYLDGAQVATATLPAAFNLSAVCGSSVGGIGSFDPYYNDPSFNGSVQYFGIFSGAVTASQIQQEYSWLVGGSITQAAPPQLSSAGGTYTSTLGLTLSAPTGGTTIYYTTDGSTPTTSSTVYNGPLSVTGSETIKAMAAGPGYNPSAVTSAQYTITGAGTASSSVRYDRWEGDLVGLSIQDFRRLGRYPQNPDETFQVDSMQVPPALANVNWSGGRLRAWVVAPVTGNYTFYAAGQYQVELYLSPDSTSYRKQLIVSVPNGSDDNIWNNIAQSPPPVVALQAGQKYYLELLYKTEGTSGFAQVGWLVPGAKAIGVIPSYDLQPFGPEDDANDNLIADAWELQHFGNLNHRADEDTDGDGLTNLQEFQLGTDPNNIYSAGDGITDAGHATGLATYDYWLNVTSGTAANFVNTARYSQSPDGRFLSTGGSPLANLGQNYVEIERGYIVPATTGTYGFENFKFNGSTVAFYLSSDATPANKQLLYSGPYAQVNRSLVAGQKYYFEMIQQVGAGADGVERADISCLLPGYQGNPTALPSSIFRPLDGAGVAAQASLPAPWQRADVRRNLGWPALPGLSSFDANGVLTMEGSGALTPYAPPFTRPGQSDDVHYVYQTLSTDGEFTARLASQDAYPWATTSGIMLRQDLTAGSTMALIDYTTTRAQINNADVYGTVAFGWRPQTDAYISFAPPVAENIAQNGPVWLRLVRLQGWIYAYTSQNGQNWNWLGEQKLAFNGPVYVGAFSSSGNNFQIAHATLDNFLLTADLNGDGILQVVGPNSGSTTVDTDLDGYSDYEEINFLYSNPNAADLQPPVTVDTVAGNTASTSSGAWGTDANGIYNVGVRGAINFTITVPTAGIYRLAIDGSPRSNSTSDTSWNVETSVDGQTTDPIRYDLALGQTGTAHVYTPWLTAGTHTVQLYLDNVSIYRSFGFAALRVEQIDGVDANNNGIPDWQEARLAALNSITSTNLASRTSPFCFEGQAQYLQALQLTVTDPTTGVLNPEPAVLPGVGNGWYANIPLNATGATAVTTHFENSGLTIQKSVTWTPTNLLDPALNGTILKARKGDSLLLQAVPAGTTSGTVAITVRQPDGTTLPVYSLNGAATQAQLFASAGTWQISGTYNDGTNPAVNGTLTVVVEEAKFATPSPEIVLGFTRDWVNPLLPADAVIQTDSRMEVVEKPAPSGGGREFQLRADSAQPRTLLARLDDGTTHGPIMDRAQTNPIEASSGAQTGISLVQQYPDGSSLVQMEVVLSSVPADISLTITIFAAGVTFDDGTTVKTFTASDFNDQGELIVKFIRGPGVTSSTCNYLNISQGSTLLETRTN